MIKKQALFDSLFLAIMGALFFGAFLGSYHLITPDEGRYVEIAREMVVSGNYITPQLDGTIFLDKPILFYWLESFLIKVFGLHEWSVRILPAFFGLFGCLVNYWAGLYLYNRRTGLLAALILMTSQLYFLASHYTDMDLMVATLVACTLWLMLIALHMPLGLKRDGCLAGAYCLLAAGFLTKGLLALVFPFLIVGVWIIVLNRWSVIKHLRLISGLFLFVILVAPWMLIVERANPEFFYYFFVVQQFSRYLTHDFNMQQPIYYYLIVVLAGMLPWTLFLFQSGRYYIKQVVGNLHKADKELFIVLWPAIIFIFFSIPSSKIAGYILPIFPPLAMMIARYFDVQWNNLPTSRNLKICAIIFLLFGIITSAVLIYTAGLNSISTSASFAYLCSIATVMMVGAVFVVGIALYQADFKKFIIALLLTTIVANIIGMSGVWSFRLNNVKSLALAVKKEIQPGDKIITYEKYFQDLPVYLQQRVYIVSNWSDPNLIKNDNWRRELAEGIIYQHYKQPFLIDNKQFAKLWYSKNRVFVFTSEHKVQELQTQIHGTIYYLLTKDGIVVLSNHAK